LPQGTKVRLVFGRHPGSEYHYVARNQVAQLEPTPRGIELIELLLYFTAVTADSLGAHLVQVTVDSSRAGSGGRVMPHPITEFDGWFNDRRERLDTLASNDTTEFIRDLTFQGTIPLPENPVGVGDSWTFGVSSKASRLRAQAVPLGFTGRATVKDLRVIEHDTVAVLAIALKLHGLLPAPKLVAPAEMNGDMKGEETFSVNHGVSWRFKVDGRIEWELSIMSATGLHPERVTFGLTTERNILP
jgi:hypothetical protein